MEASSKAAVASQPTSTLYLQRAMEFIWLLTAALIPLIFVDKAYFLSEAVNAYVEVPKTTALRTLAGMMTILWIVEWALKGGFSGGLSIAHYSSRLKNWLEEQPTRWVVVAATIYVVVAIITTLLSQSVWISMWGEVSGQFGYSAYTTVSYFMVFVIIATHLKTRAQLWRLLGVIVATGALVAAYGIIQHYNLDPLDQGESDYVRVASTMANSVFAGAVLVVTTMLTLGVGLMVLDRLGWSPLRVVLWIALIAVQFMAVYWTGARGSWLLGVPAGLIALLVLVPIAFGPRTLSAATETLLVIASVLLVVLVFAAVVAVQITLDTLLWEALVGALVFMLLVGLSFDPRAFLKTAGVVVAGLLITTLVVALTPSPSGGGGGEEGTTAVGQVQERLTSVKTHKTQVTGRGLSYRTDIWAASKGLIIDRPWFEYEGLTLSPIRPLIGYGPELFKYTFPLESPLGGLLSHAHNFFIHHWVEQGILGFFSSLSLILAFFTVGAAQLWGNRDRYSRTHMWVLVILLATMVGRVAEMMVGVAREADLVLFWIMLAMFVALPSVMAQPEMEGAQPTPATPPRPPGRRERRGGRGRRRERRALQAEGGRGGSSIPVMALVLVFPVIVFIGWLTWDKNIDYAWAARLAATAREQFTAGDFQKGERLMKSAIAKAPDVPIYHHNLGAIYDSYRRFGLQNPDQQLMTCVEYFGLEPRPNTPSQEERPYADCAWEAYFANLRGFEKNIYSPQNKLTLANSTLTLTLIGHKDKGDEAIKYYAELTDMIPSSWPLHNALATSYIRMGRPEEALDALETALTLTGGSRESSQALYLKGLAYRNLDSMEQAIDYFERSLAASSSGQYANDARQHLFRAYDSEAVAHLRENRAEEALVPLGKAIELTQGSSNSARPLYLQGIALRQLEQLDEAADALERSLEVDKAGPTAPDAHRQLAAVYADLGDPTRAEEHAKLSEEMSQQ